MKTSVHTISVTPLTPVHIGDGFELEGYEYVLAGDRYLKLDLGRLIRRLDTSGQIELNRALSSDPTAFRSLVSTKANDEDADYAAGTTMAFRELYQGRFASTDNLLTVSPFVRTDGRPYIPGSSIKGAIRTALLYEVWMRTAANGPAISARGSAETLEARLLGYLDEKGLPQIPDDPLKGLAVSDVELEMDDIQVDCVTTWKKIEGRLERMSVQSLREITVSAFSTNDQVDASGELRIRDSWLAGQRSVGRNAHGVASPMARYADEGIGAIARACNSFYLDRVLPAEMRFFRGTPIENVYRQLQEECRLAVQEQSFVLRLGWGTGLHGISLNLALPEPKNPVTRELTSHSLPLGWVVVWWWDEVRGD